MSSAIYTKEPDSIHSTSYGGTGGMADPIDAAGDWMGHGGN